MSEEVFAPEGETCDVCGNEIRGTVVTGLHWVTGLRIVTCEADGSEVVTASKGLVA